MYTRLLKPPKNKSFFLFGPRGVGKTTYLKYTFPQALYFDLLDFETYNHLLARPSRLAEQIPSNHKDWIIIDEIQRIPDLLFEVHRLIETYKYKFILTGSSARKLKAKNVNLLAGRALTIYMYPLTIQEIGKDFSLKSSLLYGHLPAVFNEEDKQKYLESYVTTYLREEVQQEGLTRNIGAFNRFLETASFSQAQIINISNIARETGIHRKVVENYFSILEDLLIGEKILPFQKRAKRRLIRHPKFYFFDVGIYRTLRPRGPLDSPEEIDGPALETLIWQEIKALNHYLNFNYQIYYWRTVQGAEVDIVLYGEKGLIGIEVKRSSLINEKDLHNLEKFKNDYPQAKCYLIYTGRQYIFWKNIHIISIADFLHILPDILINNKVNNINILLNQ